MRSAAARSPSRTGPVLPTHERVDNWLGVRPAKSCLRSRRDSRRTATRSRAASMAGWLSAAGGRGSVMPGVTGTAVLLNPEDTLAEYVAGGRLLSLRPVPRIIRRRRAAVRLAGA